MTDKWGWTNRFSFFIIIACQVKSRHVTWYCTRKVWWINWPL